MKSVFRAILFLTVLIAFSFSVNGFNQPCTGLSEQECIGSYNNGYQSDGSCNTMFYCYPKKVDGEFVGCIFVPRTNFSDCSSSSICYNGIAMDTTQYRKCFCDDGIEYKKIDPCGNSDEWSGMCIDIKSCTRGTKTFLGRTIDDFTDCDVLLEPKGIGCDSLEHDETKCYGDKLVTTRFYYKPNECGNKCVIDHLATISEKECDSCEIDKCVISKSSSSSKMITVQSKVPENSSSSPAPVIKNLSDGFDPSDYIDNLVVTNGSDNHEIIPEHERKSLEFKIKLRQDVPAGVMTIMLVFALLFISGLIFIISNR